MKFHFQWGTKPCKETGDSRVVTSCDVNTRTEVSRVSLSCRISFGFAFHVCSYIKFPAFRSVAKFVLVLPSEYVVLSPVSLLAQFCTPPEVKFHVFRRLKRGEEKSMSKIFFRLSYQNVM